MKYFPKGINEITFNANNGEQIVLMQREEDTDVIVERGGADGVIYENIMRIKPSDFVMLLNLYTYIKRNDIRNDFINPNGANSDEAQKTSHWEDYDPMGVNYPTKCTCATCGYVDTFSHKFCADCGAKMTNAVILGKEEE